ncbi:hypothetical protein BS78_01G343300 [Paspalum vaginatum]|nr:hypothetical protein BS78_01G343300 [Paspalum vaginatum]
MNRLQVALCACMRVLPVHGTGPPVTDRPTFSLLHPLVIPRADSQQQQQIMADTVVTVVRIVLAILIPPLGVFLKHGIKIEFWICLILSLLAYLPGIIYAIWVIIKD